MVTTALKLDATPRVVILSKPEFLQGDVRVFWMQIKGAMSHRMNIEEKQMTALPAHRHQKNPVQITQRRLSRDQNMPPCHRADTRKADLQLADLRSCCHFKPQEPSNPKFNSPRFAVPSLYRHPSCNKVTGGASQCQRQTDARVFGGSQ